MTTTTCLIGDDAVPRETPAEAGKSPVVPLEPALHAANVPAPTSRKNNSPAIRYCKRDSSLSSRAYLAGPPLRHLSEKLTFFILREKNASIVTFAHRFEQRLTKVNRHAVAIEHVDAEAGIETDESLLFPTRDRPAIACAFFIRPRRHAFAIRSDVASVRRAYAHLKSFDARDLHFQRA